MGCFALPCQSGCSPPTPPPLPQKLGPACLYVGHSWPFRYRQLIHLLRCLAPQGRLASLQSTCLALGAGPGGSSTALVPAQLGGGSFLEQVSATLTVLSKERAAPPLEPSRAKARAGGLPTDLRLALRELEAARKDRETLQAKVGGRCWWVGWVWLDLAAGPREGQLWGGCACKACMATKTKWPAQLVLLCAVVRR